MLVLVLYHIFVQFCMYMFAIMLRIINLYSDIISFIRGLFLLKPMLEFM